MEKIRVLVVGACGRMGREVVKAVLADPELQLVGAVDKINQNKDIGLCIGLEQLNISIRSDLGAALELEKPQVVVDFTTPGAIMQNLRETAPHKVHAVVGTTGLSPENLQEVSNLCSTHNVNILVAPNFAIGALLMMRFAAQAARYFSQVEIIELHHDQKLDAPSGTSIKTAEMIIAGRNGSCRKNLSEEKIKGVRGGEMGGIHLHSIRLPGLIAHQEVIFGGEGQTLTIRHDSLSRESFMPGVVIGIKKVLDTPGLTYGLDQIIFKDL